MSEVKRIDNPWKFLRETGLMFEINRTILHPLGMALELSVDDEGDEYLSGIWDYRDDPEGLAYAEEAFLSGLSKYMEFMHDFGEHKLSERMENMGYVIQQLADPDYVKNGVELWSYNPAYDGENTLENVVIFRVPYPWLEQKVREYFDMDVEDFIGWYTYDNTEILYQDAHNEDIIIKEHAHKDTI